MPEVAKTCAFPGGLVGGSYTRERGVSSERPYERAVERPISAFRPKSQHELIANDAAGHVTVDHECEPAEHLALGHTCLLRESISDTVCEFLVVRHQRSSAGGSPSSGNSSRYPANPVMLAARVVNPYRSTWRVADATDSSDAEPRR